MRVGDLKIPFILQDQDLGGMWQDRGILWGSLKLVHGGESSHVAIVRAGNVEKGWRLAWRNRFFLIAYVERVDEANRWLRLSLKEVEAFE